MSDILEEKSKWLAVAKYSGGVLRPKSAKHAESDDDTPAPRVITTKMAETALHDVINFFEATPSHADKDLTILWTMMADIRQLSNYRVRQSTMLDFFKIRFKIIFSVAHVPLLLNDKA